MGIRVVEPEYVGYNFYPVPFSDYLTFERKSGMQTMELSIYDITGTKIANYVVEEGERTKRLHLGHLSGGMYIIQLRDQTNRVLHTERVVK